MLLPYLIGYARFTGYPAAIVVAFILLLLAAVARKLYLRVKGARVSGRGRKRDSGRK